jgi:RHS repeat-associated protein
LNALQFHDSVTGLDYYNARFYDPVAGVFLSPDTVQGNAQGMNPYAYVKGNPESMNDPTGHWGLWDTVMAVTAVVAVAAIVTVTLVAAPVLIAACAAAVTETAVDLGATAIAAAGVTVAADTGAITGITAGGAVSMGITAGVAAGVGEINLAASNWNTDVSGQDIWGTAIMTGGMAAMGEYAGAALASTIPGTGCGVALARGAITKTIAGVAGMGGTVLKSQFQKAHAATPTHQDRLAIQVDQEKTAMRLNYSYNYQRVLQSFGLGSQGFTGYTPAQQTYIHLWRNVSEAMMI